MRINSSASALSRRQHGFDTAEYTQSHQFIVSAYRQVMSVHGKGADKHILLRKYIGLSDSFH